METYAILSQVILILLHLINLQTESRSVHLDHFLMTGSKAYLRLADSVRAGLTLGLHECHYQFKWDRWNCPLKQLSAPHNLLSSFTEVTREASFAQAISSAGVAYTITKNCSQGDFSDCRCDDSRKGVKGGYNWRWGGCSDNLHFGEHISRLFLDGRISATDAMATVSLHNNEAGRRAVRKVLKLMCKCHGVSGSCSTKTCWQQIPDFHQVGSFLKRSYRRAFDVDYQNGALQQQTRRSRRDRTEIIRKTDLVFLQESPDYCLSNGTYATLGRQCAKPQPVQVQNMENSRTKKDPQIKSCHRLCKSCGLRVVKKTVEVEESCSCKFHWCCTVQCELCTHKVDILTCTL